MLSDPLLLDRRATSDVKCQARHQAVKIESAIESVGESRQLVGSVLALPSRPNEIHPDATNIDARGLGTAFEEGKRCDRCACGPPGIACNVRRAYMTTAIKAKKSLPGPSRAIGRSSQRML